MKGAFVFISILLISILAAQIWHNLTPNHGKIDVVDALEQLSTSPEVVSKLASLERMVNNYETLPDSSGGPLYYEDNGRLKVPFHCIPAPSGGIFQGSWEETKPKILIVEVHPGACGKYFIEQDSIVKIDCPE